MTFIFVLLSIFIGFACSGILYLCTALFGRVAKKIPYPYHFPIVSILPTAVLLVFSGNSFMNIGTFRDPVNWLILLCTVAAVVLVVQLRQQDISSGKVMLEGIAGALMEIPQRLFMQTLLFLLLIQFKVGYAGPWSIISTAIVWCLGILVQQQLGKKALDRDYILEMAASFLFSLGAGYVLYRSGLILFPMLAHFGERILSIGLAKKTGR